MSNKRNIKKIKRNNAKIYPIYKMFSWDLLFFYSIEFLFYTITKHITPAEILIINGFYLLFKIIMQIPAVTISDLLGKRNSIILGNFILIIYMLVLISSKNIIGIIIADFLCALGYDIKILSESNLLYDSVSTKGGEGLYSKIDSKGGALYYILDGIAAMMSGYLFVHNNYLPLYISLGCLTISTVLSFGFKEIYVNKINKNDFSFMHLKEYNDDIKSSFKFIFKSKRMKAFILFQIVFFSLIKMIDIYKSNLLVDVGIPEEQFSMIFAILNLMGAMALFLKKPIEKKLKNKTLSYISISYILACIIIGIISIINKSQTIIPFLLIFYIVQKMDTSLWYILEAKYLKNFTNHNTRSKITFTYEFIGSLSASLFSIIGGLLLNVITVENAFLIVGLISLALIIIILDYMRTRIGLKPHQYKKEDIEFKI